MTGHLVFNGLTSELKLYVKDKGTAELRHVLECHDVGVRDAVSADPYGTECKCPPGMFYVGVPQPCAVRRSNGQVAIVNTDDRAYGCFFTPLADDPYSDAFQAHKRSGIGIHGGGSDLPNPFALRQGWEWTYGCLRLQNQDNENVLVPFINYIHKYSGDPDHAVTLTVYWGPRCA